MMRSRTSGTSREASAGMRQRPKPVMAASKAPRQRRRGPAFSSRPAGEQDRRCRPDAEAQEGQAVETDQRGGLHQPEVLAERHAGVVPGKAGEEVPAQPLADRSGRRRRRGSRQASGSQNRRARAKPKAGKKARSGRQPQHPEGHRPGELVGLDQEGGTEPPEAGDEIAEAPEPAEESCRSERRPTGGAVLDRPVEQPDGRNQREGEGGQEAEGRHGQSADGSRREGRRASGAILAR